MATPIQPGGGQRDLELLIEIARIATLDLELRPMLQRITDTLARAFECELVACVSVDRTRNQFVCEALTASIPTKVHVGYSREMGSGVVGEVAATGMPILVDDARTHRNFVETAYGSVLSELCVPVMHRGEIVAILNLESPRLAAFSGKLRLLEAIAEQVAGAISSARLYDEVRRVNRELQETNRQLSEANERLHALSSIDGLTGIANRRRFDEALASEWRRAMRNQGVLSLLMLDIDHFKSFNDHYGHVRGDDCLRMVATRLAAGVTRAGELVARYGGEEFAVLLPGIGGTQAAALAETLRRSVEELGIPHATSPVSPVVTISVGIASHGPQEREPESLLVESADRALYEAKAGGRNQIR